MTWGSRIRQRLKIDLSVVKEMAKKKYRNETLLLKSILLKLSKKWNIMLCNIETENIEIAQYTYIVFDRRRWNFIINLRINERVAKRRQNEMPIYMISLYYQIVTRGCGQKPEVTKYIMPQFSHLKCKSSGKSIAARKAWNQETFINLAYLSSQERECYL